MMRVISGGALCAGRRCLRSAGVLALAGVALAVLAVPVQARSNPRRAFAFVPIRVWIAGGTNPIPVVNATVQVRAPGTRGKLLGTGTTHSRGIAIVVASAQWPTRFNVYATGGWIGKQRFRGQLEAQVVHGTRSILQVINPVTTLSAMYCAKHGKLRPAQCDTRVARFLSIPKGIDLGEVADGQQFNGNIFLDIARRRGGLAKYFTSLVNKLDRGQATVTFALHQKSARSLRPAGKAWPGVGDSGGWLSFLEDASTTGDVVQQLFDIISGSAEAAELANIDSALTQINAQLAALQAELAQLQQQLNQDTFSLLVEGAAPYASPINNTVGDFNAVVDEAAQIGCGNYGKQPTKPCASPQSPAQVCTAAAEAANGALQAACVAFGDLPIPAGSVKFYEGPNAPPAAINSLVGVFISDVVENDRFDDSDLTTLADDFGGQLAGGVSSAYGVLQQGSSLIGQQSPFFGSSQSQQVQALDAYYCNAVVAGLTMRAAYYGFENVTSGSGLSAALTAENDLYKTSPNALPAGTFIDTSPYTMWSGQLGGVMSAPIYAGQVHIGASVYLPLDTHSGYTPNNEPGAQPPTLSGKPINNWSAAQLSQLQTLYGGVPGGHSGTDADYFTGGQTPLMWPGLINNGVWDASSFHTGIRYYEESSPKGMSFQQTPDYGYICGHGDECQLPVLDVVGCTATGNGNCAEPAWSWGSPYGFPYDVNNGVQMETAADWPVWKNWNSDPTYCVDENFFSHCTESRAYPGIMNHLFLPVLYFRPPTASECYYWPEAGSPSGSNGCPMAAPSPPTPSTRGG
jgi:hypothetical protein